MRVLHLDAVQGRCEQRSKAYGWYAGRAAEHLTWQCAKSRAVLPATQAGRRGGAGGASD